MLIDDVVEVGACLARNSLITLVLKILDFFEIIVTNYSLVGVCSHMRLLSKRS